MWKIICKFGVAIWKYKCPECDEIFYENEVLLVPDVYEEYFVDDMMIEGCPYCTSPLESSDLIEEEDDDGYDGEENDNS